MPPTIAALGQHDRAAFSCGSEPLDRYLKQQATQDLRNRIAAVFVLCQPESSTILGYYTLSASVVIPTELDPDLRKRLPRYSALPAVLLGRLAVDRRQQGKGLGKLLLFDALQRSLQYHTQIGAMAVTVDAKDDEARSFYEHYGFTRLLNHEHQLYLPMRTIGELISA